ncbi:MAG: pirin family protein [Phycisphaeraceae bacterium]|nr:pirin family protein [Phycisphaeraceae bacterium]
MIRIRDAATRGHTKWSWLDSWHSFSFGRYIDRANTHFRTLRVINDDFVAGGGGFEPHPHENMEIISYIVSGRLAHKDWMGDEKSHAHESGAGSVQVMSAGTGVTHSEFNPSKTEAMRLLQIWIFPDKEGHAPSYAQRDVPEAEKRDKLALLVSSETGGAGLKIHQDASLFATLLSPGKSVSHALAPGRGAYVQVVDGTIELNGHEMKTGDGAAVEDERSITLTGKSLSEVLLFDLK